MTARGAGEAADPAGGAPGPAAKSAARRLVRARRRARRDAPGAAAARERDARRLAEAGLALAREAEADVVALFCALPTEPPTDALARALQAARITVLLPRMLPDRDLTWHEAAGAVVGARVAGSPHDADAVRSTAAAGDPGATPGAPPATAEGAAPAGAQDAQPGTVDPPAVDPRLGADLGLDAIGGARLVLVPALATDPAGGRLGQGGGSYDRALRRIAPGALVVAVVHDDEVLESVPLEDHDVRCHGRLTPEAGWVPARTGPGHPPPPAPA